VCLLRDDSYGFCAVLKLGMERLKGNCIQAFMEMVYE
jgi:hypothetical protein